MTVPTGSMDEIVAALRAEQDGLADLVGPLETAELARDSRCAGWSLADVLVHLGQTNELAVASVNGAFGDAVASGPDTTGAADVDEWAGAAVDAERPDDLGAARDRWLASATAQAEAFAGCDPSARVQWVAGDLAARTLATTRLSETWIHSNDISWGLGVDVAPTDALFHIARLAHRTLPHAFARAGREMIADVQFRLGGPGGDQWDIGEDGAPTVLSGSAIDLCEVAGQRRDAADTDLRAEGPDAEGVLELVRTFA